LKYEKFLNFDYFDFHTHSSNIDEKIFKIYSHDINNFQIQNDTYFSIGIHPWFIDEKSIDKSMKLLEFHLKMNRCIALGESGLDKIRGADFEVQKIVFQNQITLANLHNKPLIIHCVKSYDVLLNLLKKNPPSVKCIIHGFNKNYELAKILSSKGFILSFGAFLMQDEKLQKIIQSLEADTFFLETDDSTRSIQEIYEFVAKLKGISIKDLARSQRKLYLSIFNNLTTG
jgi:TatD DNase family protein